MPVKFSLGGDRDLSIFAAARRPRTGRRRHVDIAGRRRGDRLAGSSALAYDALTDHYRYVWKTDAAWAGTCRLVVETADGGVTRELQAQVGARVAGHDHVTQGPGARPCGFAPLRSRGRRGFSMRVLLTSNPNAAVGTRRRPRRLSLG